MIQRERPDTTATTEAGIAAGDSTADVCEAYNTGDELNWVIPWRYGYCIGELVGRWRLSKVAAAFPRCPDSLTKKRVRQKWVSLIRFT